MIIKSNSIFVTEEPKSIWIVRVNTTNEKSKGTTRLKKHRDLIKNTWIKGKKHHESENKGFVNKPMVGERSSKLSEVNLRRSVLLPTPESPIIRSLNK